MFSRWSFAKSAEAMLSRWAIKRICKFVLKKKLGDYILGDIDLDQLDVQLREGKIQLNDLALNVDFVNRKLCQLDRSPLMVKEGSIASLLIKVPWKMTNCQIEVEELEIVLSPHRGSDLPVMGEADFTREDGGKCTGSSSEKTEEGNMHSGLGSVSLNVHEGVKTIAKIVNLILSSFHVRLKNLIVAFEPSSEADDKSCEPLRTLVLRVALTEFGTCVSKNVSGASIAQPSIAEPQSLLGMDKLTNFIKFKDAVVEFLEMIDIQNQSQFSSCLGRSLNEKSPSGRTTRILSGSADGFSGQLNLTIPWKNGCLDIHKLDADISIDPVKLSLQPSTIIWFISVWGSLKEAINDGASIQEKVTDSSYYKCRRRGHSTTGGYFVPPKEGIAQSEGNLSSNFDYLCRQETVSDALFPEVNVIHNWVPLSINMENYPDVDPDYDGSIDEFFECIDGMTSSHASMANSGMWNWTCSLFNAITATSSLASGCEHIPSEQQNVETNLKASIAAFTIALSFSDEQWCTHQLTDDCNVMNDLYGTTYKSIPSVNMSESLHSDCYSRHPFSDNDNPAEADSSRQNINILSATCLDLSLVLLIFPARTKFKVAVRHIKLDDHLYAVNETLSSFFKCQNDNNAETCPVHCLQSSVQDAMPPFHFSGSESKTQLDASGNVKSLSVTQSVNNSTEESHTANLYPGKRLKITLFESFEECCGEYSVSSTNQNIRSFTPASFSLKLPRFNLWIDLHLVNLLMNLFNQVKNSLGTNRRKDSESNVADVCGDCKDAKNDKYTNKTTTISREILQGNIVIPNARIMLCFCSENSDTHQLFCWDKFIALDFSPLSGLKKNRGHPITMANSGDHSYTTSTSISLNSGNLDIYLVKASDENVSGSLSQLVHNHRFSAYKILSTVSGGDDHHSSVTMLWQKAPLNDPWIARSSLKLAESQDPRSRNKATGDGYKFVSPPTAKDPVEGNSRVREDIFLCSAFLVHIHLSPVFADLRHHEYTLLYVLLKQMMNMSCLDTHNESYESIKNDQHATGNFGVQASVLLEFDSLHLCIIMDEVEEMNSSIQSDLPGSWNNLRLKIEKFELLFVSDISGICGANFFWMSHGEGELWGTIVGGNNESSASHDFLLITCKNSMLKRGDGEGRNTISYGPVGISVTHLHNPETLQGFTSVTLQCGTIVAPGFRLDWFDKIKSFFLLPPFDDYDGDSYVQNGVKYELSFFLDLVDVALSYEPHIISDSLPDSEYCYDNLNKASGQQYVGCILAAASLNLSNHISGNMRDNDYMIKLQDVGLLICLASNGLLKRERNYDANYLRESGYVKIASDTLVSSVVRTNIQGGVPWEVEFSDSHVKLDTCSDTNWGLVCLISQLQQHFAPDMEDSLVHLQSRWSSTKKAHDILEKSKMSEHSESGNEIDQSTGLMDEILDDFFHLQDKQLSHYVQSEDLSNKDSSRTSLKAKVGNQSAFVGISSLNATSSEQVPSRRYESMQNLSLNIPEIIESYNIPELLPQKLFIENHSSNGASSLNSPVNGVPGVGKDGWYQSSSIIIDENYISSANNIYEENEVHQRDVSSVNVFSTNACKAKGRILVKNIDIRWRMFGGSDWPEARKSRSSCLRSTTRDESTCLELHLLGLGVQHDMYPDGEIYVSKLSVSLRDFHLHDNSKDAPWKMVLGYYHSKYHTRESCAKSLKLDLESVRPDPSIPLEEYRLHLALLPIRLHLDQSQLNFLINFFGLGSSADESSDWHNELDRQGMSGSKKETIVEEALLPFFQKCDIWPLVVRVDYIPRNIDLAALRGGNYIQLINLVHWKGIDLQLKHVNAVGIYGWGGICEVIVGEWLEDISKNQVHKVLKGLKPIQSFFSVTSGATKMVSLPIKNYKKDRRLIKGMQRGAITFLRSVTLEAVGLGVHLAAGAHDILLQTEYALASTPSSLPSGRSKTKTNVRSNQPKDAQQGMQQAYESLGDGLGRSASALVGTPMKTYQRGAGAGLAIASVIRSVPSAAVAPASAAARAMHCALLGVRNSLDPEHMKESMDKYLGSSQSQDHR